MSITFGDIAAFLRARDRRLSGGPSAHYHSCTECYEHHACTMACAIAPDLGEHAGAPMGSPCPCDPCARRLAR